MANEALKIDRVNFMVNALIERAPRWTMIRELTKNAVEAAERSSGEKLVIWRSARYRGVRKAVIWNTGPGLDGNELRAATDLACSINKKLGLDDNFGVGAKISSLACNRHGMRFRSCKSGRVSEVILGYDEDQDVYVRFERRLSDGTKTVVIDVTRLVQDEGYVIDFDWTEVMLLGNSPDQDTAARPFADEDTEKALVAKLLYRRFYRLPDGVKMRLDPVYHRFDTARFFQPVGNRLDKFARHETVNLRERGVRVHFLHDPKIGDKSGSRLSSSGALGGATTTCCLVYRDEMYSVRTGQEWSASAPRFGIPFGSTELSVHIELLGDVCRPSQYRERLISSANGQDLVPEHFVAEVQSVMPDWVRDVIRNASPSQHIDYNSLRKELQDLLDRYKVRIPGRRQEVTGNPSQEADAGAPVDAARHVGGVDVGDSSGRKPGSRRFQDVPTGATATVAHEVFERAPTLVMLENMEDVEEKGLKGRAALLVMETGVLFVNGAYEAVDRTIADIEPEFSGKAGDEIVRAAVRDAARQAMAFRVGKAAVFALAKRASDDWDEDAMRTALTKESLSLVADDYFEGLTRVRRLVRERLRVEIAHAA